MSLDPEWSFYNVKAPSLVVTQHKDLYDQEMKDAVMRVLNSPEASPGEDVPKKEQRLFENEFSYSFSHKHALMFASSLHALYLVLRLQGFSSEDEVILAPNIEPAVANVIVQAGGRPVFVDAEEDTLNLDVSKVEKKITKHTKAIVPIHGHGHPTDMDPLMEIARKHDLFVVEDGTHATGCKYKGRRLPVGHVGVFGMVLKCLWLPASGGMLVTDDDEIEQKLRMLMSWPGRRAPGEVLDFKGKPIIHSLKTISDDVSAAVGRVQLRHLDEYTAAQRRNAKIYAELLKGLPVVLPMEKDYAEHAFLRYVIRTEKRDALLSYLNNQGVGAVVAYRTPGHLYKYYQEHYGTKKGDCPVAEKIKATELSLPEPTKDRTRWDLEFVAKRVREFFE